MDIQSPSTGLTPINDTKPAKIPRPLNSFMIFRLEKQHEIVDQCPGANHRDISKIISKWWKEISAEEKQKYINEADKLKMKHRLLYPNYKYCPQKKTRKTRAYKKRAENEFSARDFDNKQSLYALYQGGSKKKRRSKGPSDNNESSPCQKANLDTTVSLYPPPSYPYYSASPASLQLSESKVNNTSYTPHQSTPLFPVTTYYGSPIASVTYSVPSQHFGCSSSPTSISATTTNSEDVRTEPLVNYNIYSSYYAPLPPSPPTEVVHSTYPYVVGGNVTTLHYVAPNHHYPPPAAHYYNNAANNTIDYNSCLHSYDVKSNPAPPNLLTQPFYYSS